MERFQESLARYRPVTLFNIKCRPEWARLGPDLREAVEVVSQVLPFRTNEYVLEQLIDWDDVPHDPIFQLTFPQRGMLAADDYESIRTLLAAGAGRDELARRTNAIRWRLNPHPAGQLTHNIPRLEGRPLSGLQHKYAETVLYFPGQGQTCHAYCTYCFRWAQFVGAPEIKFESREVDDLVRYLAVHPEVSDVLVTGGDPLIMRAPVLRRYLEPLLDPRMENLHTIRLGTKALAYWPQKFVNEPESDEVLELFERIVRSGRHLSVMAHFSHPVEFSTAVAQEAIRRVRATGAEIRMQAPLIRHVNDRPELWAEMWRTGVRLGMVPYYMFLERDTGPREYFELPLVEAYGIFRAAFSSVSGLGRTVRGPSMSAFPGKVRILGISEIAGKKVFVLDFLQARDPEWVRRPFFAEFDESARWLDDLRPAFAEHFFFEESSPPDEEEEVA